MTSPCILSVICSCTNLFADGALSILFLRDIEANLGSV